MRRKILMLAYACAPGKGSEPGIGWDIAKHMAVRHDVWVITRSENRFAIDTEIEERNVPNLNIIYYDMPNWVLWFKRGGIGVQFHYYFWQLSASRFARAVCRKIDCDVAHHVTYGKFWRQPPPVSQVFHSFGDRWEAVKACPEPSFEGCH